MSMEKKEDEFNLREWIISWVKDIIEVGVTVGIILVILRIALGSHLLVPLVVVTSGSMMHPMGDDSWSMWMSDHNMSMSRINGMPLIEGFNRGDMIITRSPEAGLGDVIIYERDLDHYGLMGREPIIHRIVGVIYIKDGIYDNHEGSLDCFKPKDFDRYIKLVDECRDSEQCAYPMIPEDSSYKFYLTKGDNNQATDQCSSKFEIAYPVNEAQVTATGWVRLPYIGFLKLAVNAFLEVIF